MSLPDGGCLQGWSVLELAAFYVRDGEKKLLDAFGGHPLSSAGPSPDLRHITSQYYTQGPMSNYLQVPCINLK